jgi:hypothetical protein
LLGLYVIGIAIFFHIDIAFVLLLWVWIPRNVRNRSAMLTNSPKRGLLSLWHISRRAFPFRWSFTLYMGSSVRTETSPLTLISPHRQKNSFRSGVLFSYEIKRLIFQFRWRSVRRVWGPLRRMGLTKRRYYHKFHKLVTPVCF